MSEFIWLAIGIVVLAVLWKIIRRFPALIVVGVVVFLIGLHVTGQINVPLLDQIGGAR